VRHICIQIWVLWKFEFSLKSRGSPQNHRSLSLNLRFKVADLPHLSWNLLQVAWFPSVPQKPPIDVLHFPPFHFRVHTHFRSRWIPPQIQDDPSSYGNQSSGWCLSFMVRFRFVFFLPKCIFAFSFQSNCRASHFMLVVLCLVSPCTRFRMRNQDSRFFFSCSN